MRHHPGIQRLLLSITMLVTVAMLTAPLATVSGQADQPVKVDLTLYPGNPILKPGAAGEWDSGFVFVGAPIYKDGEYFLFYTGGEDFANKPRAIGYATSTDGLTWTKYAHNPILTDIPYGIPIVHDDHWELYFNDTATEDAPTRFVYRATASAPNGPWTVDQQPVLSVGSSTDWDSEGIDVNTVMLNSDQYVLYYHSTGNLGSAIGMATSPDGIHWTKFNNPATTTPALAHGDPVFTLGASGAWDSSEVIPTVIHTDRGWEMFYEGSADRGNTWNLGYATSPDGITWNRFKDNPVMTNPVGYSFWLEGILVANNQYYIYHDRFTPENVDLGLAIGTVTYSQQ